MKRALVLVALSLASCERAPPDPTDYPPGTDTPAMVSPTTGRPLAPPLTYVVVAPREQIIYRDLETGCEYLLIWNTPVPRMVGAELLNGYPRNKTQYQKGCKR